MPDSTVFLFVPDGHQELPSTGTGDLGPGDSVGTGSVQLLILPLTSLRPPPTSTSVTGVGDAPYTPPRMFHFPTYPSMLRKIRMFPRSVFLPESLINNECIIFDYGTVSSPIYDKFTSISMVWDGFPPMLTLKQVPYHITQNALPPLKRLGLLHNCFLRNS